MKLNTEKKALWGIAMTEYLIILSVIAVAAILIVSLFGEQIKNAFSSNTAALAGESVANLSVANSSAATADNMGTFNNSAGGNSSGGDPSAGGGGCIICPPKAEK